MISNTCNTCNTCNNTLLEVNTITLYCFECNNVIIEGHPIYNLDDELQFYYENENYESSI